MPAPAEHPHPLSEEERTSLTHGDFRLEDPQREVYRRALEALGNGGPPYVVSGLYALYQHTGIYRRTKDLDLMVRPHDVLAAARRLRDEGFRMVLAVPHWLAKAEQGREWIDLVYGLSNGLHFVDDGWIEHAHTGRLAGLEVPVAAPEDLIFHRLFIWERHRSDMADVAHLILVYGPHLDWDRLIRRVGDNWRLLLAQVHFFDFAYPGRGDRIPRHVREDLLDRAREALGPDPGRPSVCQGTLISRFSFAIDVNEWGFRDYRSEAVEAARSLPVVREIRESDVWHERRSGDAGLEEERREAAFAAPWGPVSLPGNGGT